MKIFVSHSNGFDFDKELYGPLRKLAANARHEIILPHEQEKDYNTQSAIKECDIVVTEASYPSTGSGIELGWASAFEKPILCIFREGSKVSSSLKKITKHFIAYTGSDDLIEKLEVALKALEKKF